MHSTEHRQPICFFIDCRFPVHIGLYYCHVAFHLFHPAALSNIQAVTFYRGPERTAECSDFFSSLCSILPEVVDLLSGRVFFVLFLRK